LSTVLVVDDDTTTRTVMARTLENRGFAVKAAADASEALELLRDWRPDLVLTDVIMPRIDGWRFAQTLRSHPEWCMIPIVFLTVLGNAGHRLRGFGLGADDYVAKPADADDLCARIERAIRRSSGMDRASRRTLEDASMFAGELRELGPASVISLIARQRKSGKLRFINGRRLITMRIDNGVIIDASSDDQPPLLGIEAVYSALGWWDGRFAFLTCPVTASEGATAVQAPVTFLLMESARREEERLA
jgi:DNA-binding response OmpR family regulator